MHLCVGEEGGDRGHANPNLPGLVFEAHRLVYHSTLGSRVIKKKKKKPPANPPHIKPGVSNSEARVSNTRTVALLTHPGTNAL